MLKKLDKILYKIVLWFIDQIIIALDYDKKSKIFKK